MFLRLSSALIGFPDLAKELGQNPIELCAEAGIPAEAMHYTDHYISCSAFYRLLELTAQRSGKYDIGLRLANRQHFDVMGPTTLAVYQADDLLGAINALQRYNHLHDQGASLEFQVSGSTVILAQRIHMLTPEETFQGVDRTALLTMGIMHHICGRDWKPKALLFRHSAPVDIQPYKKNFDCPVHFNQEVNALILDVEDLKKTSTHHKQPNPLLDSYISVMESRQPLDNLSKSKQFIRQYLHTDHCNLPMVARSIGVSPRSLQRYLKSRETSFNQLLSEIRCDAVRKYLQETNLPLSKIAETLGYTELSNFSRAFKKQFGCSPLEWRKRHRS